MKIIHRDLKLKNILYQAKKSKVKFKLCDFGTAEYKENVDSSPKCGTPGYIAPEIFKF